jgi:hypothetical protein
MGEVVWEKEIKNKGKRNKLLVEKDVYFGFLTKVVLKIRLQVVTEELLTNLECHLTIKLPQEDGE